MAALNNAVIGLLQHQRAPDVPAAQGRFAYHIDRMLAQAHTFCYTSWTLTEFCPGQNPY